MLQTATSGAARTAAVLAFFFGECSPGEGEQELWRCLLLLWQGPLVSKQQYHVLNGKLVLPLKWFLTLMFVP